MSLKFKPLRIIYKNFADVLSDVKLSVIIVAIFHLWITTYLNGYDIISCVTSQLIGEIFDLRVFAEL